MMLFTICLIALSTYSQNCRAEGYCPDFERKNGIDYWACRPINNVLNYSALIFEGLVLSDSIFDLKEAGMVCTMHRVLITKQFMGVYYADTILIANRGGIMIINGNPEGEPSRITQGDAGIFMVSKEVLKPYKIFDVNYYFTLGSGMGFIKVCDKKKEEKELMYDILTKAIGKPYKAVNKSICAD